MSTDAQSRIARFRGGRRLLVAAATMLATVLMLWRAFIQLFSTDKIDSTGLALTETGILGLYFWIAVGSALGGMARFWCSGIAAQLFGSTFPWGTVIVNVAGSFVIGFFGTLTGPDGRIFVGSTARQFVMVGVCGGYTTFSSFSLQTLNLMNDGEWLQAGANIGLSLALCLLAVWAGHALAVMLNAAKWM